MGMHNGGQRGIALWPVHRCVYHPRVLERSFTCLTKEVCTHPRTPALCPISTGDLWRFFDLMRVDIVVK